MIKELKTDQFEQIMGKEVRVVLCYTSLCGTCEQAKHMLSVVSQVLKSIHFYQINVNLFPKVAYDYQLTSIPCFLIFKQGQLLDQFYAFHSVAYLYEKIKNIALES